MNSKDFLKDYLMLFTIKEEVDPKIKGNSAAFLFYSCNDSEFRKQKDPVVYDGKIFLNTNLVDQDLEVNHNTLNNFFESLPVDCKSFYEDCVNKIKDPGVIEYICENYKYDGIQDCINSFMALDNEIDNCHDGVINKFYKIQENQKILEVLNSFKEVDPFTFKFCISKYIWVHKISSSDIKHPAFDKMMKESIEAFKSSLYRVRNKIHSLEVGHKFKSDIFHILEKSLTNPIKKPVLLLTATNSKKEETDYLFYDGFILENNKHYYPEVFSVILKHDKLRSDEWDSSVEKFIKNWIKEFKANNESMNVVVSNKYKNL